MSKTELLKFLDNLSYNANDIDELKKKYNITFFMIQSITRIGYFNFNNSSYTTTIKSFTMEHVNILIEFHKVSSSYYKSNNENLKGYIRYLIYRANKITPKNYKNRINKNNNNGTW